MIVDYRKALDEIDWEQLNDLIQEAFDECDDSSSDDQADDSVG